MTRDGPRPPIKQLATAVHHGPATRSWCGVLLLALVGGVVTLFGVIACCLGPRFMGCASGKKHRTSEINDS